MLNALGTFELARRLLGHEAIVPLDAPVLEEESAGNGLSFDTLVEYASAVREAYFAHRERLPDWPAPVVPAVDIVRLQVDHTTCTGHTHIGADSFNGFVWSRLAPSETRSFERDRLFDSLADSSCPWLGDPGWALFLSPPDFPAVRLNLGVTRIVAQHRGRWTLLRDTHDTDILVASGSLVGGEGRPTIYYDYDFTPSESGGWMRSAPEALRIAVLAEKPDSILTEFTLQT